MRLTAIFIPVLSVVAACGPVVDYEPADFLDVDALKDILKAGPVVELPNLAIVDRCALEPQAPPDPGRTWAKEICVWEATVGDPGTSKLKTGDTFRGMMPCRDWPPLSAFCGLELAPTNPEIGGTCAQAEVPSCNDKEKALTREKALDIIHASAAVAEPTMPANFFYELEPPDVGGCEEEEAGCP